MRIARPSISDSEQSSNDSNILITESTIFSALAELTRNLGTTPFNAETQSVYRIDKEISVKRTAKSKTPSNLYTTYDESIKSHHVFEYSPKIHHVSFVIRQNNTLESLR